MKDKLSQTAGDNILNQFAMALISNETSIIDDIIRIVGQNASPAVRRKRIIEKLYKYVNVYHEILDNEELEK